MLGRICDETLDLLREPGPSIHRRDCVGAARRANPDSRLGAAMLLRISGCASVVIPCLIGTKDKDVLLWIEGPLVLPCMFLARHNWVRYGRKRQGCKIRSLTAAFCEQSQMTRLAKISRDGCDSNVIAIARRPLWRFPASRGKWFFDLALALNLVQRIWPPRP